MCFWNFINYGISAIRGIIGCMCCLMLTGPILVIVGLTMLLGPNNYASMVAQYNNGWTTFQTGDLPVLTASNASMSQLGGGSVFFAPAPTAMSVTGDGVTAGIISEPLSNSAQMNSANTLTIRSPRAASTIYLNAVTNGAVPDSFSAYCSSSNSNSNGYCSSITMQNYCSSHSPSGCSYAYVPYSYSSTCKSGNNCGTCQGYKIMSSLCYVLTYDNVTGIWSRSTSMQSCLYGSGSWNTQPTTCQSSSVNGPTYLAVNFYADQDPYIVLQSVTHGTGSFGLTAAQQRGIGLALIAIGGLVTAGIVCACVMMCRAFNGNPEHKVRAYNAFGMDYTPAASSYQAVNAQPTGYPISQQPYDQPYGQPYTQTPPQYNPQYPPMPQQQGEYPQKTGYAVYQ